MHGPHSIAFILAVALLLASFAIAKTPEPGKNGAAIHKDSAAVEEKSVPPRTILFFMNPNGRPCQMQNSILTEIKDDLIGRADVRSIKTTEPGDRDLFMKYGIRGLPSLIIIDNNGKEIIRFPPGIQDKETILDALNPQKAGK
jgi:thioredoxin 1